MSALAAFFLVFARVGGIFIAAPPLAGRGLPAARVGAALLLSLIALPWMPPLQAPPDAIAMGLALVNELVVGLVLGGLIGVFLAAYQSAGHFIGLQMGLGMAQIYDPATDQTADELSTLYQRVGFAFFFAADGHWRLLRLALEGGRGLGAPGWTGAAAAQWTEAIGHSMTLAASVAMPAVGALWVTSFLVGLLVKAAPQMNLLSVDLPARILIGLVSLWVGWEAVARLFPREMAKAFGIMAGFMRAAAG